MLRRLLNHPYLYCYLVYVGSEWAFSTIGTAFGPLIPYLAANAHTTQTQYSFIFTCRSFGMLLGAFLLKSLQKRTEITLHHYIISSSFAILLFNWLFSMSITQFYQGLWLFIAAIFYSFRAIAVSTAIMLITPPQDVQFFMLITHGINGIGGLVGPVFVYTFQINTMVVSGLLTTAVSLFVLKLKAPQEIHISNKRSSEAIVQDLPWKLQYLLMLMMFVYIGMEYDYAGWISSYATLTDIASKEKATVYPFIFWGVLTLSRFGWSMVVAASTWKMRCALQGTLAVGLISIALIMIGQAEAACYFSAVGFGMSMANLYPLILSVCNEWGWSLNKHQANNIIASGVIGEGVLTMLAGSLMQWMFADMLFYFVLLMAALMLYCLSQCLSLYLELKQAKPTLQHPLVSNS